MLTFTIRLSICLFLIPACFEQVQCKRRKIPSSTELDIDQAYLTIINRNTSKSVSIFYNLVICEECDFSLLTGPLDFNNSDQEIIDTRFGYDIQVEEIAKNRTTLCSIADYQFSEHGSYTLEIFETNAGDVSCLISDSGTSSAYSTPIVVAGILLISFVVVVQLWQCSGLKNHVEILLLRFGAGESKPQEGFNAAPTSTSDDMLQIPVSSDSRTRWDNGDDVISQSGRSPLVNSMSTLNSLIKKEKSPSKRLHSLDTFRGFSLMVMIFVNYGGGGYWFFDHSTWNGLTLADLVFPWFVWMMGVSVVLSQRSLRNKLVSRPVIFVKILRRTVILFFLGLVLQGGGGNPKNLRILGVLQRLALCYFLTATIVLVLSESDAKIRQMRSQFSGNTLQTLRVDLIRSIFRFWAQWITVLALTLAWLLITFLPSFENCPAGYLGPGGKHKHGKFVNCTGGMAGYVDRLILGPSHLYDGPTCKEIYETKIPYDPEGILGILTGTLLCYLGSQAAHIFSNATSTRRICALWLAFGLITGAIGLILSKGGHSDSWIPINKNLWSLSFILILASLAFFILTFLYLIVDIYKIFTGEPWLWLGMNSIVVFVGHEICSDSFPVQFDLDNSHATRLAINAYGATFWTIIAGIMYYKKCFIAV